MEHGELHKFGNTVLWFKTMLLQGMTSTLASYKTDFKFGALLVRLGVILHFPVTVEWCAIFRMSCAAGQGLDCPFLRHLTNYGPHPHVYHDQLPYRKVIRGQGLLSSVSCTLYLNLFLFLTRQHVSSESSLNTNV